jgi:RNA polymerase sigma-70 factor (ECF subfamily)
MSPQRVGSATFSPDSSSSTESIIEASWSGDQGAFSQIAFAVNPRLFTVAQRILRDYHRAEDATQQALVLIWRKLPKLADPDKFDGWAYRIVVNACYAEARKGKRNPDGLHLLETDASAGDSQLTVANRDMLERAFDRMPVEQRAVLVLQYYLELGHPEIADLLGIPLGTVKSRAASGRNALRATLEADARAGSARWSA